MSPRTLPAAVLALALGFAVAPASAQTAPPPVPSPDLSKLPPAAAADVRAARASFDKTRDALTGDALAETYALLGSAYARNGLYDAADVALADATQIAPHAGSWVYLRGVLAAIRNQKAEAKTYFERAYALQPDYLPIRVALANLRIQGGDLEGARQVLEPFVAQHYNEAVPFAMLGDIALKQRRYADAVDRLKRALAIAPDANKLYAQLADAYQGLGRKDDADDARIKAGTNVPSLYDPIGQGMFAKGAAAASAAGAQPAAPDSRGQVLSDTMTLMSRAQYAAARQRLDGALKASPDDPLLLALYGRLEVQAGNFDAAESRIRLALAANPKNVEAYVDRALMLEMRGDDAGAARTYQQAIDLDPAAATGARLALGTLFVRTNRLEDAAAQFRAVTQSDPANDEAWTRLVAAEFARGHCADAVKALNDALRKKPDSPPLLQLLVRSASTCPAASADDRRIALGLGAKLYQGAGDVPAVGEAYALALAANGRWDDAVKTQQAAMFSVVRNGGPRAVAPYREMLRKFQAHQLPDRPWPADAYVFNPVRPKPVAAAAPAPAAKK